jgi:DNA-directed RNA polymerase specialized sigma24 family protein
MSQAVARLAQPERAVILAYYLGEMPVVEIARALGIPEGTVKPGCTADGACCARSWVSRDLR